MRVSHSLPKEPTKTPARSARSWKAECASLFRPTPTGLPQSRFKLELARTARKQPITHGEHQR